MKTFLMTLIIDILTPKFKGVSFEGSMIHVLSLETTEPKRNKFENNAEL